MSNLKRRLKRILKKFSGRLKVKRNQRRLLYLAGSFAICLLTIGLITSQVEAHNQSERLQHSLHVKQQSLLKLTEQLQAVQKQKASTDQEVQQKAAHEAQLQSQINDLNGQLQAKAQAKQSLLARATFTAPVSAAPAPQGDIQSIIIAAANAHGTNASQMLRVAQCESGFNLYAHNPSGATGLFQFMPPTFYGHGGSDIYSAVDQANVAASMFAAGQSSQWTCS